MMSLKIGNIMIGMTKITGMEGEKREMKITEGKGGRISNIVKRGLDLLHHLVLMIIALTNGVTEVIVV